MLKQQWGLEPACFSSCRRGVEWCGPDCSDVQVEAGWRRVMNAGQRVASHSGVTVTVASHKISDTLAEFGSGSSSVDKALSGDERDLCAAVSATDFTSSAPYWITAALPTVPWPLYALTQLKHGHSAHVLRISDILFVESMVELLFKGADPVTPSFQPAANPALQEDAQGFRNSIQNQIQIVLYEFFHDRVFFTLNAFSVASLQRFLLSLT